MIRKFCCLLFMGFGLQLSHAQVAAATSRDSLQHRINYEQNDSAKADLYNAMVRLLTAQLIDESMTMREFERAYAYADSGLILAQDMEYHKGAIDLICSIGSLYCYIESYDKAEDYYEQAYDLTDEKSGTQEQKIKILYNMALAYFCQEKYQQAIECYKVLQYLIRDDGSMAWVYELNISLSRVYFKMTEHKMAIELGNKALETARQLDSLKVATSLAALSLYYKADHNRIESKKAFQAARDYFQKNGEQTYEADLIYDYAQETELDRSMTQMLISVGKDLEERKQFAYSTLIYRSLCNIYEGMERKDSASFFRKKTLRMALKSGVPAKIADVYLWLGEHAMKEEKWKEAESLTLNAKQNIDIAGSAIVRIKIYDLLSAIYKKLKDTNKTLYYTKVSIALLDSLQTVENKRRMEIMQLQYSLREQWEQHESELRMQARQQSEDIASNRRFIVFALIGVLLLFLLLFNLARNFVKVRRANRKMRANQNEMLELQKNLNSSNLELDMYKSYLEEMVEKKAAEQVQKDLQLFGLANNLTGGFIYRKIVARNGKERLTYVSNNVSKLFGVKSENLIKHGSFNQLWSEEATAAIREAEKQCILTKTAFRHELSTTYNNTTLWLMICSFPQFDEDSGDVIWDGFVIDITNQKEEEERLKIAKERAEDADRQKSVFLSNMSHEIRTPMNAIMGFINFIEREDISPDKRSAYIATVRNSVNQLLKLIENIIDVSKLEIGQLQIRASAFPLNAMLRELENEFTHMTENKLLFLQLDDSNFLPDETQIVNDRLRIAQVLRKLLENAFKYTEKGYVRFGYRPYNKDELLFFVEDTGIGIAVDQQEAIFEYFRQSDDIALKPKYGGTGLGLSISKGIVEAMCGRLWLESTPDEGSSFFFTVKTNL